MKLAQRSLLVCVLLLVAGFGVHAQGDEVLDRYDLALANLSESMSALPSDVTASRDELDRAAGALRFLAARAGSPELVEAMERVFERARTAIQNRSSTDLGVQTALLRGGFQRALYDSALALDESEKELARARLARLATDLGFDEETRTALAQAEDPAAIRRIFEVGVADRVQLQLGLTEQRYTQSKDTAYRTLANAYGNFLLIQDSPRADAKLNEGFARAAQELVADRSEEMKTQLQTLAGSFERLAAAARTQPSPEGANGESSQSSTQSGAQSDQQQGQQQQGHQQQGHQNTAADDGTTPVPTATTSPDADTGNPGTVTDAALNGGVAAAGAQPQVMETTETPVAEGTLEDTATTTEDGTTSSEADAADSARADVLRALQRDLVLAGVPAARVGPVAADLQAKGIDSVEQLVDDLYASAGRLVAALQSGEAEEAQRRLTSLSSRYQGNARPLLRILSPALDDRMTRLLDRLASAPVLRSQDALVLLGQVDEMSKLLVGGSASQIERANGEATILWAGLPRLVALLLLALLAIVPLYLLHLAFGGNNRNWQLVGMALFLLLLPVIYEGLASLGAYAAELVNLPMLATGTRFSMFSSPVGQLAWVAVTAFAILFAAAGLLGICRQFGLIGGRRATIGDSQTMISTAVAGDADTVVDWDEEF